MHPNCPNPSRPRRHRSVQTCFEGRRSAEVHRVVSRQCHDAIHEGISGLSLTTTLHAASRLTPRMVSGQLKRLARNKTVPRVPGRYDRLVHRNAARLPAPTAGSRIPVDLAGFIGAFYRHDEQQMCDAARGRFTILDRTVDFGSIAEIDWEHRLPDENDHHLWRMKLTQIEVIHSLVASGDAGHHQTAVQLLDGFAGSRSFAASDAFKVGWAPYGASHRLLAMLSGLSIVAHHGGIGDEVRAHLEEFARLDAGFLWLNIEHDLRNNHTERNLAALCLYHLAAKSISARQAKILDREVKRIIQSTVLADGMQIERSAMYQGLTVMSLRIFAVCPFLSARTRDLAGSRADAAAGAWLFLTHRDGEIALFNDSWIDEVPPPASILDTGPVAVPPALPDAGYFRIGDGQVEAIVDIGEIGPRWNPGHGHADFLALEVDVQGTRFIVDPGTSQYSTGPQRTYERSAASHNGPRYVGVEPVEYSGCFKVGRLNRAEPLPESMLPVSIDEAVGGRITTSAGSCTRVVGRLPSGGVVVLDQWNSTQVTGAVDILIPGIWHLENESATVLAALSSNVATTLAVFAGRIGAIGEATWSSRYLRTDAAHSVRLEPACIAGTRRHLLWGVGVVEPSEVAPIVDELARRLAP